jgi:hypothetical protein
LAAVAASLSQPAALRYVQSRMLSIQRSEARMSAEVLISAISPIDSARDTEMKPIGC